MTPNYLKRVEEFCSETDTRGYIVRPEYKGELISLIQSILEEERDRVAGEIREIADRYAEPFEPYETIYNDLRALEDRLTPLTN